MKTHLLLVLGLFLSLNAFSQLASLSPANQATKSLKNSLSFELNTQTGYTLKYDRQLLQKGSYSLHAQIGFGSYPTFGKFELFHVPLALNHKFTKGAHSLELGGGITYSRFSKTADYIYPQYKQNYLNSFLHIGYQFSPIKKNWFLNAGYNLNINSAGPVPSSGIQLGFGLKF